MINFMGMTGPFAVSFRGEGMGCFILQTPAEVLSFLMDEHGGGFCDHNTPDAVTAWLNDRDNWDLDDDGKPFEFVLWHGEVTSIRITKIGPPTGIQSLIAPQAGLQQRGLYQRYTVAKANGEPVDMAAIYFVLRLDSFCKDRMHLEACRTAALAYSAYIASHVEAEHLADVGENLEKLVMSLSQIDPDQSKVQS